MGAPSTKTNLGVMLKLYRQRYDLSQGELGAQLGVSGAKIASLEAGHLGFTDTFLSLLVWMSLPSPPRVIANGS